MSKKMTLIGLIVLSGVIAISLITKILGAPWAVVEGLLMGLSAAIPLAYLYFPYPRLLVKAPLPVISAALVFGYYFFTAEAALAYQTGIFTVAAVLAAALYVRSSELHQRLEVSLALRGWAIAEEDNRDPQGE